MKSSHRILRVLSIGAATCLVPGLTPAAQAAFTNPPDAAWMTNGTVYSIIRSGGYVYVGGQFSRVQATPPGVPGPGFRAFGVARFDAATGIGDKTWTPDVTRADGKRGRVNALAAAGGKIWIGGAFEAVDGIPRRNLAAVSESTGAVDTGVTSQVGLDASDPIRAMVASSTTVYAGGDFTTVDGLSRRYLAAFDTGGQLLSWRPRTGGRVRSLSFDYSGGDVFAGGVFENASGPSGVLVPRDSVARFDASTGELEPWAPVDSELGNGLVAYDLDVSCPTQTLFVAFGGQNYIHALDLSDDVGNSKWGRQTAGNVQTVAVNDAGTASTSDDRVLFGGHFGGGVTYPSGTCSESKPKTAKFGVADLDGNCDLSWWPTFEGKFLGPLAILVTDAGARVWVGGAFTQVCDGTNGTCVDRTYLARFTS